MPESKKFYVKEKGIRLLEDLGYVQDVAKSDYHTIPFFHPDHPPAYAAVMSHINTWPGGYVIRYRNTLLPMIKES